MAKRIRSMRLSDRTWDQLESLAARMGVEDRTRVIEILAERESAKVEAEMNLAELLGEAAKIIRSIVENGRQATMEEFEFEAGERGWTAEMVNAVKDSPWLALEKP